MANDDMGVEEAMIVFETFLNGFVPALIIALFIIAFCYSVADRKYLIAGLLIIAMTIILVGINNFIEKQQPVVDIEPSIVYNYCPTCGQLIEVENE